jgi:hypothetical protein
VTTTAKGLGLGTRFLPGSMRQRHSLQVISPKMAPRRIWMICLRYSESGVEGWRMLYAEHETYKQIGVLCCEFYDADGKPTEKVTNTKQRIAAHPGMKEKEKKNKEL